MGHKSHDWCFYRTEEEEIGYRDMKEKTGKDGRLDVTSQGQHEPSEIGRNKGIVSPVVFRDLMALLMP